MKKIIKFIIVIIFIILVLGGSLIFVSNSVLAQGLLEQITNFLNDKSGFIYSPESQPEFVFIRETPNYTAAAGDKREGGSHRIKLEKEEKSLDLKFLSSSLTSPIRPISPIESSPSGDLSGEQQKISDDLQSQLQEIKSGVADVSEKVATIATEVANITSKAKLIDEETERSVKFEEIARNVDIVYRLSPAGIKQEIIIKSPSPNLPDHPNLPNSFTFSLYLGNLTYQEAGSGAWYFYDNGEALFRLPKAEAKDNNQSTTDEVTTEVKKQGEEILLTLKISPQWIDSPDRTFPITLEHTFEVVPEKLTVKEEGTGASFSEVPSFGRVMKLDRKLLAVPKDYSPIDAKISTPLEGVITNLELDPKTPSTRYHLKRRDYPSAKESATPSVSYNYGLSLALEVTTTDITPQANANTISWNNVLPEVNLEEKTYDGYLQKILTLKSAQSPREFSFQLQTDENVIPDDSKGGYIMLKDKQTEEELIMIRPPQGIDSQDQRIDYASALEGSKLTLKPNRPWQFDQASYPIEVYLDISPVLWNEALVKVGENCAEDGCSKDGDVVMIKPEGWNWGTEERKKYLIFKIPKMTDSERQNILAKTIKPDDPNNPNLSPDNREAAKTAILTPEDQEKVAPRKGLNRFGIDYTTLFSSQELKEIRSRMQENPVIDGRNNKSIIRKKTSPQASIIPNDQRLAYKPSSSSSFLSQLWKKIFSKAAAAGTIVKNIGSATGRNYSTLTLWEDGEDGDLVTATEIHKGEAYNDSDFNEQLTIDGSTTSSSYYMWLTAAPGQRHNGTAGTGVKMDPTTLTANRGTNYVIIYVLDTNTLIEWFEITETVSALDDGTVLHGIHFDTGGGGTAQNNLIYKLDARTHHRGIEFNNVPVNIYNNIVYDMELQGAGSGRGIQTWLTSGTANIYNNTSHSNATHGFNIQDDVGGTINLKNNIATSNGTLDYTFPWVPGTENCDYNLASDTSADDNSCTNALNSMSATNQFVSITAGSENLHLKAGADAINNGADLSATFVNDIDDTIRPQGSAFDIGADEYPATLLDMLMRHGKYFNGSGARQPFTW